MKRSLITLVLISVSFILYSQNFPSGGGINKTNNLRSKGEDASTQFDLGLHGLTTWLSETKVRVEYDWSDASQLLDWTTTNGSTLVLGNGFVTVTGGVTSVRSMVWKQLLKCTRINAQDAKAFNPSRAHLNFITNVIGWTGINFNPPEMIGLIYVSDGDFWLENGGSTTLPGPVIVAGNNYTIDVNISETVITSKSSSNNVTYSYNLKNPPDNDRQVSVGGWEGDTQWGKLTIEGEITSPVLTPSDMINIQSIGASFAPLLEVTGNPVIEWIFDDASTSASATPVKNYGSIGSRHNYLKVTPWSSLVGINVGYDATDGGYGGFAFVPNQNVSGFQNLALAKSSLQYICASHNPLTELDLRELTALKFVELLNCQNLATLWLGIHPVLERLCVEDCNLHSLDLSGCIAIKDFRSALNNYSSINWGTTGAALWHICVRSNPKFSVNLPELTQFPLLRELLTWDDNQTGAFVCHSSVIQRIDSYDNHYTSADISGCTNLIQFSLSGSQLASLNLGTANNLTDVQLNNCGLTESQIEYVLQTLDVAGQSNGILELTGDTPQSLNGLTHFNNLIGKGWTINITKFPVTGIEVTGASSATSITSDNGTLQLVISVVPLNAADKSVTWSIINGTGQATIDANGLVTAVDNGTVTAMATANDGSGVFGTLIITISNQIIPVTGIIVSGYGSATTITTDRGTLQLSASVLPGSATNKSVTWSITNGTGQAVINSTGLVTALGNGTVIAKATANDGSGIYGTMTITNSNQLIHVTGITVSGADGATSISLDNGTLQLSAVIFPVNASIKTVTWSIAEGNDLAIINPNGLVTAVDNGTVTAVATANDGSGIYNALIINITNQIVPVADITVNGEGGVTTIDNGNRTLQLIASILPANATDKTVSWSIASGTELASIGTSGLVTAFDKGSVMVRATANDGSGVYGIIGLKISSVIVITTPGDNESLKIVLTDSEMRIQFTDNSFSWKADLYNLQGRLMFSRFMDSENVVFNVSSLPSGMYLVVLSRGDELKIAKIIKP
jgi:uncharacterized protein YjdB